MIRHLCLSGDKPEERLFLQEPHDPFTTEIELKDTSAEFVQSYLNSFREPPPEDGSKAMLQDRSDTGWLVWGETMEVSRMTGPDEEVNLTDESSKEGIEILREALTEPKFWRAVSPAVDLRSVDLTLTDKMADFWAQEHSRSYPSATNIDLVVASTQLFGTTIANLIKPIVEEYLAEMSSSKIYDRHKTRAMWELSAGILRGSEDWSGNKRKALWDWFTPKLPELFSNIRHDTAKCATIGIAFLMQDRDPRRFPNLMKFLVDIGLNADFVNGSSFERKSFACQGLTLVTQRVDVVRNLIFRLGWRFSAWADQFTELYIGALSCPYAEVRVLVSSMLNSLDQIKVSDTTFPN